MFSSSLADKARCFPRLSLQRQVDHLHLTSVEPLRPLLGRTLVLVAHPDDEAVASGVVLQRMRDPIVVFATDGAPRPDFFWSAYGSREKYAAVRAREAQDALHAVGVNRFEFLCNPSPIADQELFWQLHRAFPALAAMIAARLPQAILTLAYEGGHPDHDASGFLAALAGREFGLPVWEMPLYHRTEGETRRQLFIDPANEFVIMASSEELARKQEMFAAYASQTHVLAEFAPEIERFRPMPNYDFTRAPHSGTLNYEAWQWPMTSGDLCREFARFLQSADPHLRNSEWKTIA